MLEKRVINIRVMFAIFCGLMVGILFPYLFIKNVFGFTTTLILGILIVVLIIGLFLYAELTHKYNLETRYRKNMSPLIKIACIGFFVAFIAGVFLVCMPIVSAFSLTDYGSSEVSVTGVVSDYVQEESTYNKFVLSNCSIDTGITTNHTEYKICVYSSKFINVNLGEIITFKSTLDKYEFYKDTDFNKLTQKIGYKTFISDSEYLVTNGTPLIKDVVKNTVKNVLDDNLNEDNASISYAILFGEKQGLSDNLTNMFSYAGISHILAVSGLHIGVLVSFIYYGLRKIKIHGVIRLIILGLILIFYSYLCSFTPSVCRASIVAMIASLCDVLKIRNDSLSSLSIAGIIILLFNPFSLFSISFQLSFLCVFSIISLAPTIAKLLMKFKLPKFVASLLAISISTNLVILPICMNVFTKVSLLGIITNLFVLPIFSIVYVLLFMVAVLSLIWFALGIVFVIPNMFLHLIKTIANGVTSISFGVFKVFNITYWAMFLIIIVSLIIHFLMINRKAKGITILLILMIIMAIFNVEMIPNKFDSNNVVFSLKYRSNTCYYIKDNEVTVIGSDVDSELIISDMKKLKIDNITTIIAYDLQLNDLDNLKTLCQEYNIQTVYLPLNYEYKAIAREIGNCKFFATNIINNDMKFNSIVYNEQVIGVTLNIDDIGTILIPELKPTKAESKYLLENYANVDFVYANSDDIKLDLSLINAKAIICNESSIIECIDLEDCESYILNEKNIGEML